MKRSVAAPSESGVSPNRAGAPWIVPELTVILAASTVPPSVTIPLPEAAGLTLTVFSETTAGSVSEPPATVRISGSTYGPLSIVSEPPASVTAAVESEVSTPRVRAPPTVTAASAVSVEGNTTLSPATSSGRLDQLAAALQAPPPFVCQVWTAESAREIVRRSSSVAASSETTSNVAAKSGKRESIAYFEVSKQPFGPLISLYVPTTG